MRKSNRPGKRGRDANQTDNAGKTNAWEWRILLVVFGLSFLAMDSPTELVCERRSFGGQTDCRSQAALFALFPQAPRTIVDVRAASVADSYMHSDYGSGPVHRVEFQTGAGVVPLVEVWSSDRYPKERIASEVTRFLTGKEPGKLVVREQGFLSDFKSAVPAGMLGLGLGSIVWLLVKKARTVQVEDKAP